GGRPIGAPRSALRGDRLPAADPVLAGALGPVQSRIRLRYQARAVLRAGGERRDAEARGHAQRLSGLGALDAQVLDRGPHALGEQLGAVEVGLGEDHRELLAAVAGGLVDVAGEVAKDARDLYQHEVPLRMPEGVVDL